MYFLMFRFMFYILHEFVPYVNVLLIQPHGCQNVINVKKMWLTVCMSTEMYHILRAWLNCLVTVVLNSFLKVLDQPFTVWQIMNSLACLPPAAQSAAKSYSVVCGLNAAVEALCRPTHLQHQRRTALVSDEPQQISNCGRIICLTTLKRFDMIV